MSKNTVPKKWPLMWRLFLFCLLTGHIASANADKPNIIFILTDDQGWGDLPSNWDKTEVRLPTLEALRF